MNKTLSAFLLITLSVILSSCSKENEGYRLPDLQTPVVTGYYLRDEIGYPVGTVGNPNVKTYTGENEEQSAYQLVTFPNPAAGAVMVYFAAPAGEEKHLWITRAADALTATNAVVTQNQSTLLVAGGSPLKQFDITTEISYIDLTGMEEGFYRVYVKSGDQLFYDNLVITHKD